MVKWLVRIGLALVVLCVAALVLVWVYLDSIVKRGVEKVGPTVTKTDVRLKGVKLSPFSGNGELQGLLVGNPEGFKTPSAIQVQSVAVSLQPKSVMGDKVIVRSININAPQITFEGGLQGNNLSKLLENVQGTSSKQEPATKEEQKATTRKLQVDDLVITGGKVHVAATVLGGNTATVNLPEIRLANLGQGPEGITPAELTERVLRAVLDGALKSVSGLGADMTESLKGAGTNTLQKAVKGVGDLLKKQ
jgi:hypothetical protein